MEHAVATTSCMVQVSVLASFQVTILSGPHGRSHREFLNLLKRFV